MTEWIKENKVAAVLLLVALLGAVGTYFFSSKKTEEFQEAKDLFDMHASKLQKLEGKKPFPSERNLEARGKELKEYRDKVASLQKAILAYRPEDFAKITPAEFTTRLNEVVTKLKGIYSDQEIEVPESWQLGFEIYTSSPPSDEATAFLNYQLSALDWLYSELAKAGPSALLNVHRPKLPVEDGRPMAPKGNDGPKGGGPDKPYFVLPLELTFRGQEPAFRKLVSKLAENREHFFILRSLRVQNVKFDKPPKLGDVEFEPARPAGGDDLFGGFPDFDLPGDDSAPAEDAGTPAEDAGTPAGDAGTPADDGGFVIPGPAAGEQRPGTERILGQVLGDEELHVFLQLELILFRDNVKLPEVK